MPPNIKQSWDDNDMWARSMLIAYEQIRSREDSDEKEELAKLGMK